ncbi:MAG: tetratricopeptide repeat protein [Magnetococcales bacterium]|nr:tetratricopeptide repeat protein [Magnetococcales bacterium]
MSKIIDMLNKMESFRIKSGSKTLPEDEQPHNRQRATRTVLGRAAGWSLVALLLTGGGVAAQKFIPFDYASSSLLELSSANAAVNRQGKISITSNPVGVGVLIDGKFVGVTPIKFNWMVGSHRLVLKLNGYHDVVTIVKVSESHPQELDLFLFPVGSPEQKGVTKAPVANKVQETKVAKPMVAKPEMVKREIAKPIVVKQKIAKVEAVKREVAKPIVVKQKIAKVERVEKIVAKPVEERKKTVDKIASPVGTPPKALSYLKSMGNKFSKSLVQNHSAANGLKYKYTIQVGAFIDRDSAMAYAMSWKKKGYDAYILELYGVKDPSRLWQSVRIGHFNDPTRAREASEAFKTWEKVDCYVASWDSFAPPHEAKKIVAAKKSPAKKTVKKPEVHVVSPVVEKPVPTVANVKKEMKDQQAAVRVASQHKQIKFGKDRQVIPAKPDMIVKHSSREVEAMFVEAGELRDQGKQEQAVELLEQILAIDSDHGRARRRLARIYVESGEANKALTLLQAGVAGRSTVQLTKDEPNLAAFLAALYQRDDDHWQAIDLYENLLRRYPDNGVWQMGLAISLERVGEPGDAMRAYQMALKSDDLSRKLRTFINRRIQELK